MQYFCRDDSAHLCSECITMEIHQAHHIVTLQDQVIWMYVCKYFCEVYDLSYS